MPSEPGAGGQDTQTSTSPLGFKGLYATPEDALKQVSGAYDAWSGNVTLTGVQVCYALIGANWAVFSSVNGILHSFWSKWSIVLVLLALVSNLIGAAALSEALRRRIVYAETDYKRWATEFQEALGKTSPWPFTETIDTIGWWMRWVKVVFTVASGVFLIIGAISK